MTDATAKPTVIGIEAKHITYVPDQFGKKHDAHYVKEVIHLSDGTKRSRLKEELDYQRPYWLAHDGQRNYTEKKDYEFASNLQKFMDTQINMPSAIARQLGDYTMGPNPRLKQLARCPFLYGTDVSSAACLKYDYRQRYPGLISKNTVAGGDIETNVIDVDKDGQIICMAVTFKDKALLAYYKGWVSDIPDVIEETKRMAHEVPEMKEFMKSRGIKDIEVVVCDTPADVAIVCIRKQHEWKPDFFSFWNMDFDISRILKNLEDYGVDPKTVFCDPSVKRNFQYFYYNKAEAKTTTASGVTKSKAMEELWNWVNAPAAFQCIDAMAIYRALRIAKGKESSYALDRILKKELNWKIKTDTKLSQSMMLTDSAGKPMWVSLDKVKVQDYEAPVTYTIPDLTGTGEDVVVTGNRKGHIGNYSQLPATAEYGDVYTIGEIIRTEEDVEKFKKNYKKRYETQSGGAFTQTINGEPVENLDNLKVGDQVDVQMDFGKLKYGPADHLIGIDWHKWMQTNAKVYYGLYCVIDSGRLEQLDEKVNDLSSSITMFSKYSEYKNFNSTPKRLCDDMHFWYQEQKVPKVIGSSSNQMVHPLDHHVVSAHDWVVTLPAYMAGPHGVKCVKNFPNYGTLIYAHIADLDIVSTYPTVSQILNIERSTMAMEFCGIKGVPEAVKREMGVNLTAGRVNAIEICQKILKAPTMDMLLAAYVDQKAAQGNVVQVPK